MQVASVSTAVGGGQFAGVVTARPGTRVYATAKNKASGGDMPAGYVTTASASTAFGAADEVTSPARASR
ncbi:hypothetical protein AB0J72_34645 [Dactylosporangium sp. NPDC049742]|uniref:hypothetical protein n=1 Tax=Dactylosporangium sp. NPDC049742 TaxID=3154737 RepID=UPI003427BDAB